MARTIVANLADTHGGHKLALLNPETALVRADKKGNVLYHTPELTDTQRELWARYTGDIERAFEFAAGDPLILNHVGDLTWGTKHSMGLMEVTPAEQETIALYNVRPWLRYGHIRAIRFLHGTAAHVLLDDDVSTEVRVAAALRSECPSLDVCAFYHERLDVAGVVFDNAHHGPEESNRAWLSGNTARYYLRDRMMRDDALGKAPARLYLRAHFHTLVQETLRQSFGGHPFESDLVVLPSYCSLTWYARQRTQSIPCLQTGMVLFEIVDGRLVDTVPLVISEDVRTEERID